MRAIAWGSIVFALAAALSLAAGRNPSAKGVPLSEPTSDRVEQSATAEAEPAASAPTSSVQPDLSGRARVGVASFYADRFGGRPMANGAPMELGGNNAASRTLPLGTTARVINLQTGRSAYITIQDRGPYVSGRIIDLSPATAVRIGITRQQGLAPVVVVPITVPQPDGAIKLGEGARPGTHPERADVRTNRRHAANDSI